MKGCAIVFFVLSLLIFIAAVGAAVMAPKILEFIAGDGMVFAAGAKYHMAVQSDDVAMLADAIDRERVGQFPDVESLSALKVEGVETVSYGTVTIEGESATMAMTAQDGRTGLMKLVKQDDKWRVASETW